MGVSGDLESSNARQGESWNSCCILPVAPPALIPRGSSFYIGCRPPPVLQLFALMLYSFPNLQTYEN